MTVPKVNTRFQPGRTKEECIRRAAKIFAAALDRRDSLSVEEAAREAWWPGHRLTLAEIEDKIRAQRGEAVSA